MTKLSNHPFPQRKALNLGRIFFTTRDMHIIEYVVTSVIRSCVYAMPAAGENRTQRSFNKSHWKSLFTTRSSAAKAILDKQIRVRQRVQLELEKAQQLEAKLEAQWRAALSAELPAGESGLTPAEAFR